MDRATRKRQDEGIIFLKKTVLIESNLEYLIYLMEYAQLNKN